MYMYACIFVWYIVFQRNSFFLEFGLRYSPPPPFPWCLAISKLEMKLEWISRLTNTPIRPIRQSGHTLPNPPQTYSSPCHFPFQARKYPPFFPSSFPPLSPPSSPFPFPSFWVLNSNFDATKPIMVDGLHSLHNIYTHEHIITRKQTLPIQNQKYSKHMGFTSAEKNHPFQNLKIQVGTILQVMKYQEMEKGRRLVIEVLNHL